MLTTLTKEHGLSKEQAKKIIAEIKAQTLQEVSDNGWQIMPVIAPLEPMRAAYKTFAEYTWFYGKVWAVMGANMPEYQGKPLELTDKVFGDCNRAFAISEEYRQETF